MFFYTHQEFRLFTIAVLIKKNKHTIILLNLIFYHLEKKYISFMQNVFLDQIEKKTKIN